MTILNIKSDWLEIDGHPCARWTTPHQGGRMTPSLIVVHETAGRLTHGSAVSWFMNKSSKVSAHFVIERSGIIQQLVATDRQAWHAGRSSWKGRSHCNGYSIGIELVGPGKLTARSKTEAVSWFGEVYNIDNHGIEERVTDQHGRGLWMPFTKEQIQSLDALVYALCEAYPSIEEVVGHYQISPGRKVDPNPLLPARILGPIKRPRLAVPLEHEVAHAQQRLRDLGYHCNDDRGVIGTSTASALFAFQRENNLEVTGTLSKTTVARLDASDAKEMPTGAREWVTTTALAETSRTVREQQGAKRDSQLVTLLGSITTILTALAGLLKAVGDTAISLDPEMIAIFGVAGGGALAIYGIRSWQRADRTIGYRVEDAQTGVHAGPVAAANAKT